MRNKLLEAVREADRRLYQRGHGSDNAQVFLSPRTYDEMVTSMDRQNPPPTCLGMNVRISAEIPDDTVVLVSETGAFRSAVEFARIEE